MSDTSSPDTSTVQEQNNTTELTPAKQGRKKTKSSVLSDEQKKVCIYMKLLQFVINETKIFFLYTNLILLGTSYCIRTKTKRKYTF